MIAPAQINELTIQRLAKQAKPRAAAYFDAGKQAIDLIWCELQFAPAHIERVQALLALCDGTQDQVHLAEQLSWKYDSLAALVASLYRHGVLIDDSHEATPALLCQDHLVSRGRTLRARMSAEVNLLSGSPHRRLLLGSLVETYHFVSAASFHIGAALSSAPSATIRDGLASLLADEWQHGKDLKVGLLHAGLAEEDIVQSRPLPGTASVLNYLHTLGSTDLLSYGVCAAINESPKSDTTIKETWDRIATLGLLPPAAVTPFRGHELEDEASDHTAISALLFSEHATISWTQRQRIQAHVLTFIATQKQCYQSMRQFYDDEQGPTLFKGVQW